MHDDDCNYPCCLPPLKIGAVVKVFSTSSSSPIWFYDPDTNKCTTEYSREPFEVGKVRERRGDCYRVTVLRRGRELFVDFRSRHWIRMSHERAPRIRQN